MWAFMVWAVAALAAAVLWVRLGESQMLSSSECILSCLNLPCSAQSRAAYDCSMAKKRRAEKQALGVPVNKRKSLLMKPRHYSPDVDCKGNPDNRNEDDGLLETNDHSTAVRSSKAFQKKECGFVAWAIPRNQCV
ncbi:hypothetical protein ACRRTK_021522 [Alexandromys fortis]